jgi:hypothetical protein
MGSRSKRLLVSTRGRVLQLDLAVKGRALNVALAQEEHREGACKGGCSISHPGPRRSFHHPMAGQAATALVAGQEVHLLRAGRKVRMAALHGQAAQHAPVALCAEAVLDMEALHASA